LSKEVTDSENLKALCAMPIYPEAHGRGIALIVVRLLELAHKLLGEGLLGRFPPQNSGRLNWRPFFIHVPLGVLAMLRPAGDDSHA
jgi:hypothetical protein